MESVEFNAIRKAALFELLDQPSLVNLFSFVFVIEFDFDPTIIILKSEKKQIVLDGEIRITSNFFELSIDILLADYLYFFVIVYNINTFKFLKSI